MQPDHTPNAVEIYTEYNIRHFNYVGGMIAGIEHNDS